MAAKKKNNIDKLLNPQALEQVDLLEQGYMDELKTNVKYSLEIDPENKYNMLEDQKRFIKNYIQFKNIPIAAKLSDIDEQTATAYFLAYSSQQEIRRINLAMYHRQFATKLLSIDEIGGYLTSVLTDENVPIADRLSTKEKLDVAKMIIDLNKLKANSLEKPQILDAVVIEDQLKDLSVESIQHLINVSANSEKEEESRQEVIDQIRNQNDKLTPEELAYMKTLPLDSLLEMLESLKEV